MGEVGQIFSVYPALTNQGERGERKITKKQQVKERQSQNRNEHKSDKPIPTPV